MIRQNTHGKVFIPLSIAVFPVVCLGIMVFLAVYGLREFMNPHTRPYGYQNITFRLSPRGDRIVFNAMGYGDRDLFLLDLNELKVTQVTDTADYETCPAFSPDGRSLVYSSGRPEDRADHLVIKDLDTNRVRQLTSAKANDGSPTFSPDGSRIVFTRDTHYNGGGLAASWSGGGSVWSIGRDGSGLRRVLPSTIFAISPHLSSNGKTLLWWDTDGVWVAPADGTGTPRLIAAGGRDAALSPDGDKIAFTQGQYGPELTIYLVPVTGGQPTLLTQTSAGCYNPEFSPDGKTIYFFIENSPEGGSGYSLWRIGIKGDHLEEIAGSGLIDNPMSPANFKH